MKPSGSVGGVRTQRRRVCLACTAMTSTSPTCSERVAARLDDRLEADLVDGAPHQRRPDDHGRLGQHLERGRVQVVEVQVRDEHGVEVMAHGGVGQRPVAAQRPGPALQRRVREDAHAVHLDEHRAVTDVGDSRGAERPARGHGRTSSSRRGRGSTAVDCRRRLPVVVPPHSRLRPPVRHPRGSGHVAPAAGELASVRLGGERDHGHRHAGGRRVDHAPAAHVHPHVVDLRRRRRGRRRGRRRAAPRARP